MSADITRHAMDAFDANPAAHVMRLHKNQVTVEKKGAWTWLKANLLYRNEYKLKNIVMSLQNVESKQSFITAVNKKSNSYNEVHKLKGDSRIPRIASILLRDEKSEYNKELIFIQGLVDDFLQPFLGGTPASIDRPALIESLFPAFKSKFPDSMLTKDDVCELALDAYFDRVARAANELLGHKLSEFAKTLVDMPSSAEIVRLEAELRELKAKNEPLIGKARMEKSTEIKVTKEAEFTAKMEAESERLKSEIEGKYTASLHVEIPIDFSNRGLDNQTIDRGFQQALRHYEEKKSAAKSREGESYLIGTSRMLAAARESILKPREAIETQAIEVRSDVARQVSLFIYTQTSDTKLQIDCPADKTVKDLRHAIAEQVGKNADDIVLLFSKGRNEAVLEDQMTVDDIAIAINGPDIKALEEQGHKILRWVEKPSQDVLKNIKFRPAPKDGGGVT